MDIRLHARFMHVAYFNIFEKDFKISKSDTALGFISTFETRINIETHFHLRVKKGVLVSGGQSKSTDTVLKYYSSKNKKVQIFHFTLVKVQKYLTFSVLKY